MTTLPFVTVKSFELKLATPLLVSDASSPLIVTVLSVTAISIPSPPANVSEESRRLTLSDPVSPAIESSVEIVAVETVVKRPFASTVRTGIAVCEPYVPADTVVLSRV